MFCHHCGARLPPGNAHCGGCGHPVAAGTSDIAATELGLLTSASSSLPALASGSGPLTPGHAFGARYRVIRLLGIGGMGAVYQAWDDALSTSVALKVIRREASTDAAGARDVERRFKRELLLARQVTHKNVVRIHDLGEIDGITYLTMPYIHGRDLASILRSDGTLLITRALTIARQIAEGLQAAHEAGVIHRDLKPANIMIDEDDHAVVMDFGIARSMYRRTRIGQRVDGNQAAGLRANA
ncbi:MAG: serine/threonine-protein kinase [Acidobacteriota bacterium]